MSGKHHLQGLRLRKHKLRVLSQKRTRKHLKRKNKNKNLNKNKKNKINNILISSLNESPIFRIFNKHHFYKKAFIKNNTAIINIPKVFSFSKNAYATINILKEIAFSVKYNYGIYINHQNCQEIDIAASLVMDSIIMEYVSIYEKLKLKINLSGTLSNTSKVNEILVFSGIIQDLNLNPVPNSPKFKLLHFIKNADSGTLTTKIINYYSDCLNTQGFCLTPEGEQYFSTMLGEIIGNCSEHGGEDAQWYALGHFTTEDGECNLSIFDFGDTIYEGLKNNCHYQKTLDKLNQLTKIHEEKYHNNDEELLWTLFSLQHGISRANSYIDETRGQGTIDLIDSFQKLGQKYTENKQIIKPIMSITSGNINILFDGTYKIKEASNKLKVIAFNKENDIEKSPDKKYVKNIHNYFPGTVISIKFFIDRKYIEEVKK